jgi:phosphate transport system permease protein
LPLGPGLLAGSLTLMLVILPMVIIASQEALRAVPDSLREGALGMGATHWQAVWNVSLPAAVPGIMTGAILAMSRAIGEAAPVLIISGIVFIASPPQNLVDDFSVMPLQIYDWAGKPANQGFHSLAAGGIIVLLLLLLVFNGIAVAIRQRLQKPLS